MKIKMLAIAAAGALSIASSVAAATTGFTVGVTEGSRAIVDGTTKIGDAPQGNGSYDLGAIGAGDTLGLYGRIVSKVDQYKFQFSAASGFEVNFDFDGYEVGGVHVAESGLVNESGSKKKGVAFSLEDANGVQVASTGLLLTNITTGNPLLFGASAGSYFLVVDGSQGPFKGNAALYDLTISAVPLPAALPLLLAGLAGLAFISRRRRSV
ncbi:VPLPA-CTERM sorting domain-containing protein [Pikeienuella sp. HZG-20]|uniref:VPLPA-CTERM sorting domain-containing protein n=1 Tax=Paludibacillus litoralis TaxID=3133267 RepID=UPI0030EBB35D